MQIYKKIGDNGYYLLEFITIYSQKYCYEKSLINVVLLISKNFVSIQLDRCFDY